MSRVFDLSAMQKFAPGETGVRQPFVDLMTLGCSLTCLEPGQEVRPHVHTRADDVWVVLEGEATYLLGNGGTHRLRPGMLAVARAGEVHGARNDGSGRFVFVSAFGPIPIDFVDGTP